MKKSIVFKVFALINFIVLITLFLLYRNGSLFHSGDNFSSPNGGTINKSVSDTLKAPIYQFDTIRREVPRATYLPSSKSIVLIEEPKFLIDTFLIKGSALEKNANFTPSGIITPPKTIDSNLTRPMLHGTKSGMIVK